MLRLEDAEIVDQNIGIARAFDESLDTLRRAEVCRNGLDFRLRQRLCEPLPGGLGRLFAAPVEDDCRACFCKPARNGEANSGGRAGDDGPFSVKLDLHGSAPQCD
jgi:hypothetical protein